MTLGKHRLVVYNVCEFIKTFMNNGGISVIIPVYNECRTISTILEIVKLWGKAQEIIVVDDGSTDKTVQAVSRIASVNLISYKKNQGKGYALTAGIKKSHGSVLMFLDGDMLGLTRADLDEIVNPMIRGQADMVLGLARFWSAGSFEPFNDLTGIRVVKKDIIENLLTRISASGYGVELILNNAHKHLRIVRVPLEHVYILGKLEKQKMSDAALTYVKEARELMTETIRQQSKMMSPRARDILKNIVKYLKLTMEVLQQPL
ncbi:hypothetical protein A2154_01255 [Candidatus Gottesmanbacteria bacterium RBG_16_43_7]|uniref:Glycosyltransferase 2-like domain-containing protein n=1 Tax=Candidatus Gottesmanbacteria bacterium RBG_16_43_7 TaxID=1798373 RepID=A0A1F5Z8L3_9BACT|nr:MAG: hypothetical protein A2154_01255 [Candidatus Gottesmanbacteria bacterium RBG_16_43_7]